MSVKAEPRQQSASETPGKSARRVISLVARGLTLLWLVLVGWLVWRMPAPRPLEARDVNTAALEPLMRQLADRR